MANVLVYCPLSPEPPVIHPRTLESIFALEWDGTAEIVFGKEDMSVMPGSVDGNVNITKKYNRARQMALGGGYDALFTVEADMIVPSNAIHRLYMDPLGADVVYGLYVSRHGSHPWLAFSKVTPQIRGSKSMGETWREREAMWGNVVETVGVGLGCTLIRRHVLEAIPFRVEDHMVANDWYFSLDLQDRGFTQAHDCGVVCGHIEGYLTYWPDVAHGYRVDEPDPIEMEELLGMANGKYTVIRTLSLGSGFAYPGELVELDDETAKILIRKRVIKPVEIENKQVTLEEVKAYGTDN